MKYYTLLSLCVFMLLAIIVVFINSDEDDKIPIIIIEHVDQSNWRNWWQISFFACGKSSVEKYDKMAEFHNRKVIVNDVKSTGKNTLQQIIRRFCKLGDSVSKIVPGVPYYSISVHSELCNKKILINAPASGFDLTPKSNSSISSNNISDDNRKWIIKTISELCDGRIK